MVRQNKPPPAETTNKRKKPSGVATEKTVGGVPWGGKEEGRPRKSRAGNGVVTGRRKGLRGEGKQATFCFRE